MPTVGRGILNSAGKLGMNASGKGALYDGGPCDCCDGCPCSCECNYLVSICDGLIEIIVGQTSDYSWGGTNPDGYSATITYDPAGACGTDLVLVVTFPDADTLRFTATTGSGTLCPEDATWEWDEAGSSADSCLPYDTIEVCGSVECKLAVGDTIHYVGTAEFENGASDDQTLPGVIVTYNETYEYDLLLTWNGSTWDCEYDITEYSVFFPGSSYEGCETEIDEDNHYTGTTSAIVDHVGTGVNEKLRIQTLGDEFYLYCQNSSTGTCSTSSHKCWAVSDNGCDGGAYVRDGMSSYTNNTAGDTCNYNTADTCSDVYWRTPSGSQNCDGVPVGEELYRYNKEIVLFTLDFALGDDPEPTAEVTAL